MVTQRIPCPSSRVAFVRPFEGTIPLITQVMIEGEMMSLVLIVKKTLEGHLLPFSLYLH
jgi:predicted ATP-grasp superfamily ATP-dependent carboligase